MAYEGMLAEIISMNGDQGDPISAYVARPLGPGPFPGMALIHHAPGWDEWYRETTRKFAHHGYAAVSHNLYHGPGAFVAARSAPRGSSRPALPRGRPRRRCSWCGKRRDRSLAHPDPELQQIPPDPLRTP